MEGDEALPLPWHRVDAEEVTDGSSVGAAMGDADDVGVGRVLVPQRRPVVQPELAGRVEELLQAVRDASVEPVERLAALEPFPVVVVGLVIFIL